MKMQKPFVSLSLFLMTLAIAMGAINLAVHGGGTQQPRSYYEAGFAALATFILAAIIFFCEGTDTYGRKAITYWRVSP